MESLESTLSKYLTGIATVADYFLTVGVPQGTLQTYLAYNAQPKPEILSQFPPSNPYLALPEELPNFCMPWGFKVFKGNNYLPPKVFSQVLTDDQGNSLYLSCLLLHEKSYEETEDTNSTVDTANLTESRSRLKTQRSLPNHDPLYHAITPRPRLTTETSFFEERSISTLQSPASSRGTNQLCFMVPKCLVFVSRVPFFNRFQKVLLKLYQLCYKKLRYPMECYISHFILQTPLPVRGLVDVTYKLEGSSFKFELPALDRLPLLDVNLGILFKTLDLDNILLLFNALSLERSVVFLSSNENTLFSCSYSLLSFLVPFHWSLVYVPLLPANLLDYLLSPVNFVYGIHSSLENEVYSFCTENVLIVDLDTNTLIHNTSEELPGPPKHYGNKLESILSRLLVNAGALKEKSTRLEKPLLDEITSYKIRDAFFYFFVSNLKNYKRFVNFNAAYSIEKGTFDSKAFLSTAPRNARNYLAELIKTQMFANFCDNLVSPTSPQEHYEVLLFDEQIAAKLNRSKLKLNKIPTPLLDSTSKQKVIAYEIPKLSQTYNSKEEYIYSNFPDFSYSALVEYGLPQEKPPYYGVPLGTLKRSKPSVSKSFCEVTSRLITFDSFLDYTTVKSLKSSELQFYQIDEEAEEVEEVILEEESVFNTEKIPKDIVC